MKKSKANLTMCWSIGKSNTKTDRKVENKPLWQKHGYKEPLGEFIENQFKKRIEKEHLQNNIKPMDDFIREFPLNENNAPSTDAEHEELEEMLEGKKFDQGKPDYSLIPALAEREVVKVLTMGKEKYGAYNWMKGMDFSRLEGALRRHLSEHKLGNDIDDESGLDHLAHVIVNAMFLLEYKLRDIGNDDRVK